MNHWFLFFSFLLGLGLTWLWLVRSVSREVFVKTSGEQHPTDSRASDITPA